jgi:hypothetical protein
VSGTFRPVRIEEGRLVERVCPDCGNVERRALGESISQRGELASYAVGWTAGHDDRVAFMTIGIGIGNPSGGSFHIEICEVDGHYGMRLVDRPFERVPQGGPDLTREQALEHEDLRYIWFVADQVMEQDRRALWLKHWLLATRAFVTDGVLADYTAVRRVRRENDGDWQLFDTLDADAGQPRVVHLSHVLDADPTMLEVVDLPTGSEAQRHSRQERWARHGA